MVAGSCVEWSAVAPGSVLRVAPPEHGHSDSEDRSFVSSTQRKLSITLSSAIHQRRDREDGLGAVLT